MPATRCAQVRLCMSDPSLGWERYIPPGGTFCVLGYRSRSVDEHGRSHMDSSSVAVQMGTAAGICHAME